MARKQKRSQAQQVKGFSGFMYRSVVYTSHVLFQTSSRMLCNSFSPPKNDTTRSKATVSAQQVETLESSTHKKNSAMHVHRRRLAWSWFACLLLAGIPKDRICRAPTHACHQYPGPGPSCRFPIDCLAIEHTHLLAHLPCVAPASAIPLHDDGKWLF